MCIRDRYLGVVLAFIQAFTMVYAFDKSYGILSGAGVSTYLYVATVLTAGTMFLLSLIHILLSFTTLN